MPKRSNPQGSSQVTTVTTKRTKAAPASKSKTKRDKITNKTTVNLGLGFPKRCMITHRYYQTIATSATLITNRTWTCNGLFDPDITGTGHQPLYFDDMARIYNHYTVIGSKCKFTYVPASVTNNASYFAAFINDDTTVVPANVDQVAEQTSAKVNYVPHGANEPHSITLSWSAKKTFGGSILGNDNLQGTSSANPTEQSYYTFSFGAMDGIASVGAFITVDIEYIAIWEELRDQNQN